ncbi:MAG: hypothetical protein IPK81_17310 [Rhodospirillales bacterium]|nr:MAG: hypothetical protein IPK81_17310 [Rhodospirillales bacterium]
MLTPRSFENLEEAPAELGAALEALWWLRHGNWDQAHKCVQAHEGDADCDWVHAHLHRQEGDLSNAGYWYRRAGRAIPDVALEEEWRRIATAMLSK